jgi:hypothetical protein
VAALAAPEPVADRPLCRRHPVFRGADGSLSVGVPNAAQLDGEGRVKLKPDGKRDYKSIISFETTEGRERFQRLVLAALADAGIGGAV